MYFINSRLIYIVGVGSTLHGHGGRDILIEKKGLEIAFERRDGEAVWESLKVTSKVWEPWH